MGKFLYPTSMRQFAYSCPPRNLEDPIHGFGEKTEDQIAFFVDEELCIGCHSCTVACFNETYSAGYPGAEGEGPSHINADEAELVGQKRRWIIDIEEGEFPDVTRFMSSLSCRHCAAPRCVDICPVDAMWVEEDGSVAYSVDDCVGCKLCRQVCPYEVPQFVDIGGRVKMVKCGYCQHIPKDHARPCERACPTGALKAGPVGELADLMEERGYALDYQLSQQSMIGSLGKMAALAVPSTWLLNRFGFNQENTDEIKNTTQS